MHTLKYFDSHCHPYFADYDADRAEVLARMSEKGVGGIVVGTNVETSRQAIELAQQHNFLWASVGLHPNDDEDFDISKFRDLAQQPKVVAVGECGLDYFRSNGEGQREKFEAQLMLAQKLGLPVIVHCRNAHEDCSNILQNVRMLVPVVMHFFTAPAEVAKKYLDLGCYLSFPGPITFTDQYDESIKLCPLEKLLVETDSPFAAPAPFRGRRNEPAYVEYVVAKIAAVKDLTPEEVAAQTLQNAQKVFGLQM